MGLPFSLYQASVLHVGPSSSLGSQSGQPAHLLFVQSSLGGPLPMLRARTPPHPLPPHPCLPATSPCLCHWPRGLQQRLMRMAGFHCCKNVKEGEDGGELWCSRLLQPTLPQSLCQPACMGLQRLASSPLRAPCSAQ